MCRSVVDYTNLTQSPIAGMVFVKQGHSIGQLSIHFPPHPTSDDDDNFDRLLPFFNFQGMHNLATHTNGIDTVLDNGHPLPARKLFQKGCHFHKKTNTFHGVIDWTAVSSYSITHSFTHFLIYASCRLWYRNLSSVHNFIRTYI